VQIFEHVAHADRRINFRVTAVAFQRLVEVVNQRTSVAIIELHYAALRPVGLDGGNSNPSARTVRVSIMVISFCSLVSVSCDYRSRTVGGHDPA